MILKPSVLLVVCLLLLAASAMSGGCTATAPGNQSFPQDTVSATPQVPAADTTTKEETTAAPPVKTTRVPTTAKTPVTTRTTPKPDPLTVTLHSALKQSKIGTRTPSGGNIFLVLEVTIRNNDRFQDFSYTDASFIIIDKKNEEKKDAITSKFTYGLNNPLSKGKIIMQSETSGQIVFSVTDNLARKYQLNVVDATGTLVTSLNDISAA